MLAGTDTEMSGWGTGVAEHIDPSPCYLPWNPQQLLSALPCLCINKHVVRDRHKPYCTSHPARQACHGVYLSHALAYTPTPTPRHVHVVARANCLCCPLCLLLDPCLHALTACVLTHHPRTPCVACVHPPTCGHWCWLQQLVVQLLSLQLSQLSLKVINIHVLQE